MWFLFFLPATQHKDESIVISHIKTLKKAIFYALLFIEEVIWALCISRGILILSSVYSL